MKFILSFILTVMLNYLLANEEQTLQEDAALRSNQDYRPFKNDFAELGKVPITESNFGGGQEDIHINNPTSAPTTKRNLDDSSEESLESKESNESNESKESSSSSGSSGSSIFSSSSGSDTSYNSASSNVENSEPASEITSTEINNISSGSGSENDNLQSIETSTSGSSSSIGIGSGDDDLQNNESKFSGGGSTELPKPESHANLENLETQPLLLNIENIQPNVGNSANPDTLSHQLPNDFETNLIVTRFKYPCEIHKVITQDGYVLTIHRIPRSNTRPASHKIVLLVGDFWTTSQFWVVTGPKHSLSFYLADLGYDVWLGNMRGTKYGQEHTILEPSHIAFWHFSFDLVGYYDIPNMIDYILINTKSTQLCYIGWGYGATSYFVMISEHPEYAKKIRNMQALAPTVFMNNTQSLVLQELRHFDETIMYEMVGRYEIIPHKFLLKKSGQDVCLTKSQDKRFCNYLQPLFCGYNFIGLDNNYFPDILQFPRSQGSTRFLIHMLQQVRHGGFRKYNHGTITNLCRYGKSVPPEYELGATTVPTVIYYSAADILATEVDVLAVSKAIPTAKVYLVECENFSHLHFALSNSGQRCYYQHVKQVLAHN